MILRAAWLTLLLCSGGCEPLSEASPKVQVALSVESDPGVPLEGVPVRVDGRLIGHSDAEGHLRIELSGYSGQLVRLRGQCPDGHSSEPDSQELRLRSYEEHELASPIHVALQCIPNVHLAVFIVRAARVPNIGVLLDGELVASTNREGLAHFSTQTSAGTQHLVELVASAHPKLVPQRASRLVKAPAHHELFVIDQTFEPREKGRRTRSNRHSIIKIE